MEKNSEFHLYKDINARTGGEIYLVLPDLWEPENQR